MIRILLAGKSTITRERLMEFLEENSLQASIIDCCTGLSALEIVNKFPIDIVISHLDLPVLGDGAKLLFYAKQFNPDIYTLSVGQGEDYVTLDPALETNIDDFIASPFTPQELGMRLRKVFRTIHENKISTAASKGNKNSFLNLGKFKDSFFKPSEKHEALDKKMKTSPLSSSSKSIDRIKRGRNSWGLKMLSCVTRTVPFLAYLYVLFRILTLVNAHPIYSIPAVILAALPVIILVIYSINRAPGKREKRMTLKYGTTKRRYKRIKNNWVSAVLLKIQIL